MGPFENRHVNFWTFCLPGAKVKESLHRYTISKSTCHVGRTDFYPMFFFLFFCGCMMEPPMFLTSDEHYGKSGSVDTMNLTSRVASEKNPHKSQVCSR